MTACLTPTPVPQPAPARAATRVCASLGAAALALAALVLPISQAHAQPTPWPKAQPIRLIAVFPPGGSVDQVARILQPALQRQLGQTVVVENRGGASGSIGAAAVAASPPDGYTFAVVFDSHASLPALIPGLPYDTKRDLPPVALLGTSAMVIAAHPDSPYRSFGDAVAAARTARGVSYGSIGSGSLGHLALALLAKGSSLNLVHVPYKGGGPLMNDALAGHVPVSIGSIFLVKPHLDSKRLRPLAVTTSQRSAALPDVPTIAESGFAGFDAPAWWAVLAPARTPPEIVRQMNEAINAVLRQAEVSQRLAGQGIEIFTGSPEAARAFVEAQVDVWGKVIRDNGIKAD